MKILISGICGFAGCTLALALRELRPDWAISGFDNFIRPGSESNRASLKTAGIKLFHADLRFASDIEVLPAADWVIDAAATPTVMAGIDGRTSSRQLVEHNLLGTVNLLEYCKKNSAGFILLSTSRVYSIAALARLPVEVEDGAFSMQAAGLDTIGVSAEGVRESFSTASPISLYGSTKLASEAIALEYGETFSFPVWINRCGILAGAGQFGRPDQGIFAYWIHSWLRDKPLKYIGFSGQGHQVRDCLHPRDMAPLLIRQTQTAGKEKPRVQNVSGGSTSAMSLSQLSAWCAQRFGPRVVASEPAARAFDVPWLVLDSTQAQEHWQWQPETKLLKILEEIAVHAEKNPDWLELSAAL